MPPSKPNLTFPIVGANFHPPATQILKLLPLNTPLVLYPEPDNPYDPNAIAVYIAQKDVPESKLTPANREKLHYNRNLELHLGYIPAVDAATLNFNRTLTILGEFKLSDTNKPSVRLTAFRKD